MPFDRSPHQGSSRRHPRIHPLAWAIAAALAPVAAGALPQDGVVKQGAATIQTPQAGLMLINQASQTAAVDWRSFSVGKGETVNIVQPNSQALLINRVIGYDPTRILGQINANGRVVLSNPRGVYFTADSQLDVGSLVATTLGISDADLHSGVLRLGASTGGAGELRAEGRIRAADAVALVAPQLGVSGSIDARRVALAAASQVSVDVEGDGLVLFNVRNDAQLQTRLDTLGTINATQSAELRAAARAGFADTVLNMEGVVRARSLEGVAGRIVVDGGPQGVTWVDGRLDASGGAGHAGGDVLVQGQRVMLDANAQLDASGDTGGGRIRVGGDFHGANAELRNAEMLIARPGASLKADAVTRGDGGKVVLWSEQSTVYAGSLSARGGAQGGNGGQAEISGRQGLSFDGLSDLGAARGRAGQLLLDPNNITISSSGSGNISGNISFDVASPAPDRTIRDNNLQSLLGSQDVVLQANDTITVNSGVGISATRQLTLQAGGGISINGTASLSTRGLSLLANDPGGNQTGSGAVSIASTATISAGSGTLTISNNGGTGVHALNTDLTAATLNISGDFTTSGPVQLATTGTSTLASNITLGGSLTVAGAGSLTLNGNIGETAVSGISKVGLGTLTLGGSNSYTGATQVSAGKLVATNASALGTTAAGTTVASGAALEIANVNIGSEALTLSGNGIGSAGALVGSGTAAASGAVTLAANASIGAASGGSLALTGAVGESGGARNLTKVGSGTLSLGGASANTYTGTTTVSAGTLVAAKAAALGTSAAGTTVSSGATLEINNVDIGAEAVTVSGTGVGGAGALVGTGAGAAVAAVTLAADASIGGTGTLTVGSLGESSSASLTKVGSGSLALTAGTYTGTTSISGGTLTLLADSALPNTAVTVGSGATLAMGTFNNTVAGLSLQGGTVSGSGTLTSTTDFDIQGGSVGANLAGAVGLNKTTTASATLSGNNSYTGTTAISGGTLVAGSATALGTTAAGTTVASGAALEIANVNIGTEALSLAGTGVGSAGALVGTGAGAAAGGAITLTANASIGGTGTLALGGAIGESVGPFGLTKVGTGSLSLATAATYTGATTVSAGTLALGASGVLPSGTSLTVATGGTLAMGAFNNTVAGLSLQGGTVSGSGTLTSTTPFDIQSGSINAVLAGSVDLNKTTAGTATLSGAAAYTGATSVGNGTLALGASGVLPTATNVTVTSGGTLAMGAFNNTVASLSLQGGTVSGSGTLTSTTAFDIQSGTVNAVLAGGVGLNKTTTGTATLAGLNAYTGATTVSAGTLATGATNALPSGSAVTVGTGATLDLGAFNSNVAGLSLQGGTVNGTGALSSTTAFDIQSGTVNAGLSGAVGLNKTTTGTATLAGNDSYTGSTAITAGTLVAAHANALGSSATGTTVSAGATLQIANVAILAEPISIAGNGVAGAGALIGTGSSAAAGGAITMTSNASVGGTGTLTLNGGIGEAVGPFSLTKVGSGTVVLGAVGSYTGSTTISAGTLTLAAANVLPAGSSITVDAAGTLNLGTFSQTVAALSLQGGMVGGTGTVTSTSAYDIQSGTVSANLTGSAGLNKTTAATATLTGSNSYTGTTTISAGTLAIGDGGSTGTLGTGAVAGSGTLAFNHNDAITVANAIGGGLSLSQQGPATVTLTGTNTYTGTTTIGAVSTLAVGNGGSTGTLGSGVVTNNGVLQLNRSDDLVLANDISGAGRLDKLGSNTVSLTGTNTGTFLTRVLAGTLSVGNGGTSGSLGTGIVQIDGTLAFNRSDDFGIAAPLTGAGTVTKLGNNTVTLTAVNYNSGTTTIAAGGALTVGSGGTLGSGPIVNNGTLNIDNGTSSSVGGAISGAGNLHVLGSSQAGLSGANTYSGGTTVDAGSTVTLSGSAGALGTGTVLDNGALAFNFAAPATIPNAIGGSGTLTNRAGGNVTLTGANTYSGSTTVEALSTLIIGNGGSTGALGSGPVNGTGTLAFNRSDNITVGNVIGDNLNLSQTGAGTLTLTGANTYAGTTTVATGSTLAVGSGGTTGSLGAGAVTTNGTLAFNRSDAVTIANAIGGSGGLQALGTGTVALTATNSYTGTTTIAPGSTLSVGNGGSTGTLGSGAVTDNGTLLLNTLAPPSTSITIPNAIGGSGALVKQDGGWVTLTGNNSYTGTTTISAGTLFVGSGGSTGTLGSGAVVNNATLEFNRSDSLSVANAISGTGALYQLGGGTLVITGNNGYSGQTRILGGTVDVGGGGSSGSLGTGPISNQGLLRFTRSDPLVLLSQSITGTGTLVQAGTGVLKVDIPNTVVQNSIQVLSGQLAQVGPGTFSSVGSALLVDGATSVFNASTAPASFGSVTVRNGGSMTGTGTVTATTYALQNASIAGALGTGTMTVTGATTLSGTSAASQVNVNTGGALTLSGSGGRLTGTPIVDVAGGATLTLAGNETAAALTLSGTLAKAGATGTLTAATYTLDDGANVGADLGAGTLSSNGNTTLSGLSNATAVNVDSGTLSLGTAYRFANAPALTVAGGAALKLGGNENIMTGSGPGSLDLTGTLNVTHPGDMLVAGSYALHDGAIVNASLGVGTVNSDGATVTVNAPMAAATVNVLSGRLTLAGSNLLAAGATLNVSAPAALKLGGDATITQLNLSGQLEAAGPSTLTATAGYALDGATTLANANLGGQGALTASGTSTVNGTLGAPTVAVASHGTLILAAPDNRLTGAPAITVNSHGTLTLQGNNTATSISLGTGAVVNGSGSLTASNYVLDNATYDANLTGGSLISRNTSVLNGQSTATSVTVETGSLTLGSADRFTLLPNVVIDSGATLALGGNQHFGSLAGGGHLVLADYALTTGSTQSTQFSGWISGSDSAALVKDGATTTFTLPGGSISAGLTRVQAGTLQLAGNDGLQANTHMVVDSGATLLINGQEAVKSLTAAGTLAQTSATDNLIVITAALNDGAQVRVNLSSAAGTTSNGNVTLGGTFSGALTVASGTFTLSAADRLDDHSGVTVAAGATLQLNGNDTIAGLTSAGTVARTGTADTLTAGSYILNDGAVVNANLGAGNLNSHGTTTLNGTSGAGQVVVVDGQLRLGAADRLADTATVSVRAGASLLLNGSDTVGSLSNIGTLARTQATDTLTAATYGLGDGSVTNANLGTGKLNVFGTARLNGTAAAQAVAVDSGNLLLGGPGLLAPNAAVRVAAQSTLTLNGDLTVASLDIAGRLDRSTPGDTLTAAATTASQGAQLIANLGSGTLDTSGDVHMSGKAAVQTLRVNDGTLTLNGSNLLGAAPATTLAGGSTLLLNGDLTLGSLAGAGTVQATGGTLAVGSGGSSQFDGLYRGGGQLRKEGSGTLTLTGANDYSGATTIADGVLQLGAGGTGGVIGAGAVVNNGVLRVQRSDTLALPNAISGSGALEQTGTGTLVLTGSNSYSGSTLIAAGTLQVGDGGSSGTLGSGAVSDAGLLRLQRSDAVTLSQAVSGTGGVEQAGSGTLTLATALQTTGTTKVSKGSLVTPGDERIANSSDVVVDAGAQLQLGGNETLGSLTGAGNVALQGNLGSAGDVKIGGILSLTGGGPHTLSAAHLDAQNTANVLGSQPLSLSAQSVQLKTADSAALKLGTVSLAADSAISAGTIELTGDVALTGGTTTLVAAAAPAAYAAQAGKQAANAQQLAVAGATISQTGGLIHASSGALALQARGGGSITLLDGAANDLGGGISAVSGTAGSAWSANSSADQTVAQQSRISLSGDTLRVNGAGIDGDLVVIDAAKLSSAAGSVIRARLPYSAALGFAVQLPGLTLKLRDPAFTQAYSFGAPGDGNALAIDVGSSVPTIPAGFMTILPKKPANLGATAVFANGPAVGTNGYQFFYDGARRSTEVPVVYNGVAPSTPEAQGSISATVAVSEGARKDRFEEAVRTENVAIRLRAGVIAEVGAGRPATVGKEGIRPPEGCTPSATLGCEP